MRKIVMGLLAASMVMPAMAVDGYKNLKFGMSPKEVKEKKVCSFGKASIDDNGLKSMDCMDFSFSGKKTYAGAYFIDDKLVRLGIMLKDTNQLKSVMVGIKEKYGAPSTFPTQQQLNAIDSLPNQTVDFGFDDDTVIIRALSNEMNVQNYILMYTVNTYDELLLAKASNANKDDL